MASSVPASLHNLPLWTLFLSSVVLLPTLLILTLHLLLLPSILTDPRRRHLPPGPWGLPLIGSYLSLRNSDAVPDKARAWTKKYGPVFHMRIGGTDWIWLSTPRAVKNLNDKKSAIYSSRPPAPLANDIASAGRRQLFMPYSPRYRAVRKMSHALLNIKRSVSYQPVQDLESKQLLFDLLRDPDRFYDHNRRYSASVIISVTYGHRIPSWDNELAREVHKVVNNMQHYAAPGTWLVDTFPALARWPEWMFGNWKSFGKKCHDHDAPIYVGLWEELKREVREGVAKACFCKDFLESEPEKLGFDNEHAAYQCGGLVEAGSETTSAALNFFLGFATQYPNVVKKAQEELDHVVGGERYPTWSDEEKLPYVRAIIKELLRMRPPNKVGIHHSNTEDDWYRGMFIPKGSMVILNWWEINFDPTRYESPFEFKPERYLGYDQSAASYLNTADPYERDHFSYGAGRRVCPGIHLAEKSLFLNISRILWGFDISKKKADGGELRPPGVMIPGWMCIPAPFDCDILVRSRKHAELIERLWTEVGSV